MKRLHTIARPHTMAFTALFFLAGTGSALAQSFQSYGECQRALDEAESEASRWDTAWMDCAANVRNGSVQNCKGMDSYQSNRIKQQLAQRRDAQLARKQLLAPVCQRMRSQERQALIDSAAQNQQRAEEERQRQRQIQMTQDQFARAQQAEERKQQEMLQSRRNYEQWQQQRTAIATANAAAAAARNQAKAQTIGNIAGALLGTLGSRSDDSEDRDIPPSYIATERIVEKGRDKVQSTQNSLVNQIQNQAWDAIKSTNRDTIRETKQLGDTISSFANEKSSATLKSGSNNTSSSTISQNISSDIENFLSQNPGSPPAIDSTPDLATNRKNSGRNEQKSLAWIDESQSRDSETDYSGKPCNYLTRENFMDGQKKNNFHPDGTYVCYGNKMYYCKSKRWIAKGSCEKFAS